MSNRSNMIALFTDFGHHGPYLGQMQSCLFQKAPTTSVINLFSDVPSYNIKAAAYLLAAYNSGFAHNTVFLCVVDPGVGDEKRKPVVLKTKQAWYVGPENGLFNVVAAQQGVESYWEIIWRPETLSASFHGRDLFAPIAAAIASDNDYQALLNPRTVPTAVSKTPISIEQIIYIDHFGNLITGMRAGQLHKTDEIVLQRHRIGYARTFSSVSKGQCFWYENANGLIEIAVNQGNAKKELNVDVGDTIKRISK